MPANKAKDENFGPVTSRLYGVFAKAFPSMRDFYSFIAGDISNRKFDSLLDVGCGPGILDMKIAEQKPLAIIYGIDPSKYMISIAKRSAKRYGVRNTHFMCGKNTSIPINKKFDIIMSTLSFHHWAVKAPALEYLSGCLSDKGLLIIYEFLKPETGMSIEGSHSLSIAEARSFSDLKGLRLADAKARGKFIRVIFSRR